LVADTLEQARKLAFDGESRRRVVTIDGSMISKSGLMTGGTSASGKSAKNAKRWVWMCLLFVHFFFSYFFFIIFFVAWLLVNRLFFLFVFSTLIYFHF
jgi:hypothetical protein